LGEVFLAKELFRPRDFGRGLFGQGRLAMGFAPIWLFRLELLGKGFRQRFLAYRVFREGFIWPKSFFDQNGFWAKRAFLAHEPRQRFLKFT
jgi:hypothetical protein